MKIEDAIYCLRMDTCTKCIGYDECMEETGTGRCFEAASMGADAIEKQIPKKRRAWTSTQWDAQLAGLRFLIGLNIAHTAGKS